MNRSIIAASGRLGLTVLLVAIAAGVPTVSSGTGSGATKRPLSLKVHVSETLSFLGVPPCYALSIVQGGGRSDLLGHFSMVSQDCVNPQRNFDPGGRNVFAFASLPSQLVFTAANGDRLYASYSGVVGRRGQIRGHFVITGGTGDFLAATGGGTLSGDEDTSQIVTAQGTFEAEGEITY